MLIVTVPSAEDDVVATNHLSVQDVEDRLVFEVAVVQDEVLDSLVGHIVLLLQPRLQVVCELHRGLRRDAHRLVNNSNSGDNKYSGNNNSSNNNTKNNNHSSNEPCRACGSHTCPHCRGCSNS